MTWTIFLGYNLDMLSFMGRSNFLETGSGWISEIVLGGRVDPWMFYASYGFSRMPPGALFSYKIDYRVMMGRRVKRFNILAGVVSSEPVLPGILDPDILLPSWGIQTEVSFPLIKEFSLRWVKLTPSIAPRVGVTYYPVLWWRRYMNRIEKKNVLRFHARTMVTLGVGR